MDEFSFCHFMRFFSCVHTFKHALFATVLQAVTPEAPTKTVTLAQVASFFIPGALVFPVITHKRLKNSTFCNFSALHLDAIILGDVSRSFLMSSIIYIYLYSFLLYCIITVTLENFKHNINETEFGFGVFFFFAETCVYLLKMHNARRCSLIKGK